MDCKFCYAIFGQRSYRRRSADAIIEEIRFLRHEYAIDSIAFVDDNLTVKRDHLRQVCEQLERENIVWGCHGRVDTADHGRLEMMARSGCKWLGFGIESGSQKILDAMRKRTTVDKARGAINRTREHGIFPNTTFIHGYPGENIETIRETLLFKLELGLRSGSFFATPYPGTELFDEAVERGLIGDLHDYLASLDNAYDFRVNFTEMSDAELLQTRLEADDQLMTALQIQGLQFAPENKKATLDRAMRMLDRPAIVPEVKGVILVGLSRFFGAHGDLEQGARLRELAAHMGVVTNAEARVVFTKRRTAKPKVDLPLAG